LIAIVIVANSYIKYGVAISSDPVEWL